MRWTIHSIPNDWHYSKFLFDFFMDDVGVEQTNDENYDEYYADDLMCLLVFTEYAQRMVDRLTRGVAPFGMCFGLSSLQDWTGGVL